MNEAAKTEWSDAVKEVSPHESRRFLALVPELIEEVMKKALPSVVERLLEKKGYSSEVDGLLRLLAAKSNDTYEDVLRKALTLYSFALDAKEQGNRLAVLNPEDEIVHEIIGLGSSTAPHPVGSE